MLNKIKKMFETKEKIMNAIGIVFIIVLEIVLLLGIGRPNDTNWDIIYPIIAIFSSVYLITRHIILKDIKVISNILDVLVIILCFSPLVPIIFKTSVLLNNAVIVGFRYICAFNVYLVIKNILKNNEKGVEIFKNVLIISTFILCILSLDQLMSREIVGFLYKIVKLTTTTQVNGILHSSIGYNNTFSVVLGCSWIILLEQYCKSKNKITKTLYLVTSYLFVFCMLATISIGGIGITAIAGIIYYVFNKEKRNQLLSVVIPTCIISIINYAIFRRLLLTQSYLLVYVLLVVSALLNVLMVYFFSKFINKISSRVKRGLVIITISMVLVLLGIIIVGLKCIVPLKIFENEKSNQKEKYVYYNVEPNTNYDIEFDIDAKVVNKAEKEIYKIIVTQQNKYSDKIDAETIVFSKFKGKKYIRITTKENCQYINISYYSNNTKLQDTLLINELKINGEKQPTSYLYLPRELTNKIFLLLNDGFKNKSVYEREECLKACLKIGQVNWLFGTGGNTWNALYRRYITYFFSDTNSHFYVFQMFFEFGIAALLSYTGIFIYVIITMFKKRKNIDIALAILIVVFHSMVDFDLVYLLVLYNWIGLIAIISANSEKEWKVNKYITCIILPILLILNVYMSSYIFAKTKMYDNKGYDLEKTEKYLNVYSFDKKIREKYINMCIENKNYSTAIKEYIKYIENESIYEGISMHREMLKLVLDTNNEITKEERLEFLTKQYNYLEEEVNNNSFSYNEKINLVNELLEYSKVFKENIQDSEVEEIEFYNKYCNICQRANESTRDLIMNNSDKLRIYGKAVTSRIDILEDYSNKLSELIEK